jgi:hypothetical protein
MRIYRCAARPSEDGAVAFAQGAFLGGHANDRLDGPESDPCVPAQANQFGPR